MVVVTRALVAVLLLLLAPAVGAASVESMEASAPATPLSAEDGATQQSSSVFVLPGPLGNCRLAWVYSPTEFGVNPSYLECLQSEGDPSS